MSKRYYGNDLVLGTDEQGSPIQLRGVQRWLHTYLAGLTGAGKSRLVQSMVWQDIVQWSRSRHGLAIFDMDGECNDSIMARLARYPQYWNRPIVHIDLRRSDRIVGYNLLRRRPSDDPAVVALSLLEAISTAFGEVDVMAKPTLYRTAVTILRALIEADLSIAHAPLVLDPAQRELRERLASFITEPTALANLSRINNMRGREFDDETLAFANRMFAPLSNSVLRHMFGQTEASFDFDRALEEGWIVLVTLASEGNRITETDARLVGALMIADLWQAGKRRGKRSAGVVKGFYVYVDEFQTMLTPTIAAQLSRARGYGLYFTLANQLVSQLRDNGGASGDAIYHAVIGNTHNKIAFRASTDEEDLRPLTRAVFLDQVDVNQVKDEIEGYQVVGHEEVRRVLKGGGATTNWQKSRSTMDAHSDGEAHASGAQHGAGYGSNSGMSMPIAMPGVDDSVLGMNTEGTFDTYQDSTNEQDSSSSADTHATTEGEAEGRATTRTFMESIQLRPILEKRVTSRTFESVENQLFAFDQAIAALPHRHAYTRLAGAVAPTLIRTLDMPDAFASAELVEKMCRFTQQRLAFVLPFADAAKNLLANRQALTPPPVQPEPEEELVGFTRKRAAPRIRAKEADHVE
jgi:TraM recognition site of TraD and TraG